MQLYNQCITDRMRNFSKMHVGIKLFKLARKLLAQNFRFQIWHCTRHSRT